MVHSRRSIVSAVRGLRLKRLGTSHGVDCSFRGLVLQVWV